MNRECLGDKVRRLEDEAVTLRRILDHERREREATVAAEVQRRAAAHGRQWTGWLKRGEWAERRLRDLVKATAPLARAIIGWTPAPETDRLANIMPGAHATWITRADLFDLAAAWKAADGPAQVAQLDEDHGARWVAEADALGARSLLADLYCKVQLAMVAIERAGLGHDEEETAAWLTALEASHEAALAGCTGSVHQPLRVAVDELLEAVQVAFRWRWSPTTRTPCPHTCSSGEGRPCDCGLERIAQAIAYLDRMGLVSRWPRESAAINV